jgi:hypothetical protein
MKFSKFRIAALSREPSFQLRSVLGILVAGLVIAFVVSLLRKEKVPENPGSGMMARMQRLHERPSISSRRDCVLLLDRIRSGSEWLSAFLRAPNLESLREGAFPGMEAPKEAGQFLSPEELSLLMKFQVMTAFMTKPEADDVTPFATAAAKDPPSGIISSMHGDLLWLSGKYEEALAAYERGAADEETGADCRRRALDLCRRRGWTDRLLRLYKLPGWRDAALEPGVGYDRHSSEIAAAASDWTGMLKVSWLDVVSSLRHTRWVIMSSLCGLLWFLVIHMGACIPVKLWWRGLLGFALGVLSIPLTLFIIKVQETWLGVGQDSSTGDILYCISGIGLREELAKLILFVPMLFLLRKAQAAHVLAVAACVGLGFAVQENVDYFSMDGAVWGRFLTANFLHFALTGLTGLALWQAVRNSAWLTHFMWILVGAVVFHGLWDFRPGDVRYAGDYNYFKYVGLAVLSLYFFRELCRYAQPVPGIPSVLFVYLTGGALLVSTVMVMSTVDMGFRFALVDTFKPVIGLFIIGAAMFYQLRRA